MKFNLTTGDVVKFSIYPTLLLKIDQSDLVYKGEIAADLCPQFGTNTSQEWVKAYTSLPAGVVNDAEKYPWLLFKTVSGQIIVINSEWINASTLVVTGKTIIWIAEVRGNAITPEIIRKQLSTVGVDILNIYSKGA
jgi:hypothetical protein